MSTSKSQSNLEDIEHRMEGALEALRKEFIGLRTGRVSAHLLDSVTVEIYGTHLPLTQVGTISTPEPRVLTVNVWDPHLVKAVEKAIQKAPLGLNPQPQGQIIRIVIPELTQERRQELSRLAGKYAENTRIAVRNVRRDGMDHIKKMEKNSELSQDEHKRWADKIQHVTDHHIHQIDDMVATKEQEILQF